MIAARKPLKAISAKPKKCKNPACRQPFTPANSMQSVCHYKCGLALAAIERKRKESITAKLDRQKTRERRAKLKSRADYMREAQQAWNRYVRARDAGFPCASCGAMPSQKIGGTIDCSHYRSVGSSPHMRFHLHNAAAACVRCNRDLSGNVVELRKGLIERIGEEKVLAVEADQSVRKYTIDYLVRLKKVFSKKARRQEKRYQEELSWKEM